MVGTLQTQRALESVNPKLVTAGPASSRLPMIFLLGALGALWFICCRYLSAEWSFNEQYSYGWFVPFFAVYLFWNRWADRPAPQQPTRKFIAGFLIVAAAVVL